MDAERIPERIVHAKGGGAYGFFEVTNDVTKYTNADVFSKIGKKTQVVVRFSSVVQSIGGNDASREMKGLAAKFYTKDGNLDFVAIHFPVYFYRDPINFIPFAHCFKRNPKTNLIDFNSRWDFITKKPNTIHGILWLLSDYGLPDGYRKIDAFPIHTYEINNELGERHYVKFNFRTLQGLANLTNAQALALGDLDYYNRDLYNSIEEGDYPVWKLEMDVMSVDDIKNLDYNPFEVSRMWKKGDYHTVTIGRMVLNKNPDNFFRDLEQSAFNPANLVPGIPGPVDLLFKSRRLAYRDTQNYRLGVNHNKISVNQPRYAKTYLRDGKPPIKDNMKDAPNYFPNSFNGPLSYVDERRPKEKLVVFETNAVDLQPAADFYNEYVRDEAHRERLANNTVETLSDVYPYLIKRVVRLLTLVDADLGSRVRQGLKVARATEAKSTTRRKSQRLRMRDSAKYKYSQLHS